MSESEHELAARGTDSGKAPWEPMQVTCLGNVTELVQGGSEPPAHGKLSIETLDRGVVGKKPSGPE